MTITERVNGERLVLLAWGRAILMQLAHPLVAQGVADHSSFRDTTVTRLRRLHDTIKAMLDLTFGDASARGAAADRINAIHDRVHGTLSEDAGPWRAGTLYSATDPALLTWVEATLLDSMPLAYQEFVAPLAPEEIDEYCREASTGSPLLRIPPGMVPASGAALRVYLQQVFDGDVLAVTSVARELAREVIDPPGARALWPATTVTRLATIGWLPPRIRAAYGFPWTADDAAKLAAWCKRIRIARRYLPSALARWSASRI
jgi:uncharacterized protein (DUF2236 family)